MQFKVVFAMLLAALAFCAVLPTVDSFMPMHYIANSEICHKFVEDVPSFFCESCCGGKGYTSIEEGDDFCTCKKSADVKSNAGDKLVSAKKASMI